ncbi:calcium-activated chloride channel regulator 2 isoform X2 [Sagmatias obliquidens]|uniref:calcium-activated chloride channel regulator 2 isoform X2 n=1 Tax=Sagmatias obliquidens TaxID=3371155 RepID=UPI000F445E8A|nr:calcium-activated chloride channel regulator 2 isoform X2 [Lagenorhynchus obliquidens]
MTHGDSAGPVCSLKFVTLLVVLGPELLFLGAGVQLQENGYNGLLVAINPQVSEDQKLIPNIKEMITEASYYLFNATKRRVFFRNIKILIPATWKANNYSKVKQESYEKANVIVTDWYGAHGDDPYTLQYRGCGKEGKYIHFTLDFLLNDDLTAVYGSRGRVFVHEWAHLRWGVFDEYNSEKPFYVNGQNQIKVTRCSSDITGIFLCERGPCPQENCIISKILQEGCMFIYNSTQNATASIMFMQSLSSADRLLQLQQAAEFYLMQIVEIHTFVGIATFNSKGTIRAQLHQINNDDDRKLLVSYLPTTVSAEAETSICSGLKKGFEMVEKLNGKAFGSVMILVTSGDDEHVTNCFLTVLSSGSTIHTIALGSSAVKNLEELSHLTGGLKFFVPDKSNSNSMLDAFSRISSGTGNIFQQHIQLESIGEYVKRHHQLKNTVTVDHSVGNDTTFLVTWQTSGPPEIVLFDPNGRKYYTDDFTTNLAFRTARLWIPGTAKPGLWTYTLNNTHHSPQALKVTVTSGASRSAMPPATVEAFVERDSTHFPHPVTIYAIVRKGFYPILNATVTATIESETADPVTLKLFDDGAGADVIKNDGIYSRYFFSFAVNGRYSLKVHVNHSPSISALAHSIPGSHAMYVPGYITNGNIQMNAPRKSVGRREEEQKWGFSRISSGGSFLVLGVPADPHPDVFPPCKIIDLEAVKSEEEVTLSWTAPGEDFDQGQANSYEIRVSKSLQNIQDDFNNAILVNTSKLNPQQAGTKEIFTFSSELFTNGLEHQPDGETQKSLRIYVAIRAVDRNSLKSAVSNVAQASLLIPPNSAPVFARDDFMLKGVLTAMGFIGIICLIIVVTHCVLNRKTRADKKENETKLL